MATLHTIAMTVNGQTYEGKLEARVTLADCLRTPPDDSGQHPVGLRRARAQALSWRGGRGRACVREA